MVLDKYMLFIFGKKISNTKNIIYALTNIFGINLHNAKNICKYLGINPSVRIDSLNKLKIKKLVQYIDKFLTVENDLRRKISKSKKELIELKTVRGLRSLRNLPLRGQRTHSNYNTQKKLRRTLKNEFKKKNTSQKHKNK